MGAPAMALADVGLAKQCNGTEIRQNEPCYTSPVRTWGTWLPFAGSQLTLVLPERFLHLWLQSTTASMWAGC